VHNFTSRLRGDVMDVAARIIAIRADILSEDQDEDESVCNDPMMEMMLRAEIFPGDLDATVDFYTNVPRFRVAADRRAEPDGYVALERGSVRIGAAPARTAPRS
jgi:hypothetical protein